MIGDLTPRKGHFSFSPWQRHGKTVPKKEYALVGLEGRRMRLIHKRPEGEVAAARVTQLGRWR